METPKQQFSARVNVFLGDTAAPFLRVFGMQSPIETLRSRPRGAPARSVDRLRRYSSPTAGLKPGADGIRRVRPLGSPKLEGQHDRTSRKTGGHARSQVDPPQDGTGARVHRHRCWRDHSPPRLAGCSMDGPPSLASLQPLVAALREARLNGFLGALAVVPRHRIADHRRRVSDASPTALSDATKVDKPVYPRYNRGAGEGLRPFDPQQTRAPVDCAGGGVAPLPPVTALPDG